MKKEDLKIGNELQSRIENIESKIEKLKNKSKTSFIEIVIVDHGCLTIKDNLSYSEKANMNLDYLNQLYRDNVLKTLEDCKDELEEEFKLL